MFSLNYTKEATNLWEKALNFLFPHDGSESPLSLTVKDKGNLKDFLVNMIKTSLENTSLRKRAVGAIYEHFSDEGKQLLSDLASKVEGDEKEIETVKHCIYRWVYGPIQSEWPK